MCTTEVCDDDDNDSGSSIRDNFTVSCQKLLQKLSQHLANISKSSKCFSLCNCCDLSTDINANVCCDVIRVNANFITKMPRN